MVRPLFIFAIFTYVITVVFPQIDLGLPLAAASLLIVASTFFSVGRFVQVTGGIFLALGIMMLASSGAGPADYLFSFGPMLNLLTLFAMVPILALPIRLGNYGDAIQSVIQKKVNSSGRLYMMTSGLSYFFSIFMNLATLPMTYYSIQPVTKSFNLADQERFMSRAITHGFAMPLMWAPVTPIVGIVIEMTGVSWGAILPYILPLSIAGLLLDWYLGRRAAIKNNDGQAYSNTAAEELAAAREQSAGASPRPRRLLHVLAAILIFNVLISIFEQLFHFSFIILVALLVIPFALTWSLLIGRGAEFGRGLKEHTRNHLLKMKEQFFIFLAAGFFISAIKFSGTDHLLNVWITGIREMIGIQVFLVLLPLLPLGLAFIGLHPAIAVALMAEALDPQALGISPYILTVSILAGAVSAFLMGPYNATIGLMSSIVKTSSFKVSNWNGAFTALFLGSAMVYLTVLQMMQL
ncbi:hypothetical protein [Bacillus marinisedimentorum]|uniref:hypothetical protein n=1 Tax=Bacillus marinisedimentorum TaxID=1821260 RepID=UPI0007E2015D|nr:hypothetical protein [Bacillus marinisedimentorum]